MNNPIELQFVTRGDAFSVEGNNSAFIHREGLEDKEGRLERDRLILLDCGETVFTDLRRFGVLQDPLITTVVVTHLHPDHIGSLGSLIFYNWYNYDYHNVTNLVVHKDARLKLETILKLQGIQEEMYEIMEDSECAITNGVAIDLIEVEHAQPDLDSYGVLLLADENGIIFYSGDARHIPTKIAEGFRAGHIDKIYVDTSFNYMQEVHKHYYELKGLIDEKDRNRCYCMHLGENADLELIKNDGFQIPLTLEERQNREQTKGISDTLP